MKATKKQVGFVYKLLHLQGAGDIKEDLALAHSTGRTTHLSDLEQDEVRSLIDFLKKQVNLPETPASRMRGKILSMAHEVRWQLPGTTKIDMARVDAWSIKYGYKHKPLHELTDDELPLIVTQFERMYKDFLKGI